MKRIGLLAALVGLLSSGCCLMDWERSRPSLIPVDKARDVIAHRAKEAATPQKAAIPDPNPPSTVPKICQAR